MFCEGCVWVSGGTEACFTGTVPAHCRPEGTTVLPPSATDSLFSSHAYYIEGRRDETASTGHLVCFHTNTIPYASTAEDWWEVLVLDRNLKTLFAKSDTHLCNKIVRLP